MTLFLAPSVSAQSNQMAAFDLLASAASNDAAAQETET